MNEIAEALNRLAAAYEEWNSIQRERLVYDKQFWTTPEKVEQDRTITQENLVSVTKAMFACAEKLSEEAGHLRFLRERNERGEGKPVLP